MFLLSLEYDSFAPVSWMFSFLVAFCYGACASQSQLVANFLYFEGNPQQLAIKMDLSEQDLAAARNKMNYSMRKDEELKRGYNEAAIPNGKLDKRKAKFCLLAWIFKQKKLVCSSMFGVKGCYVRFNMFCCCNLVVWNSRSSVQIQRGSCIFRKDLEQHSLDKIFFLSRFCCS